MSLGTNFEFLFIGRGEDSFLENYAYELSTDDADKGGKIFLNVEITNNQAEAETVAEQMFTVFKDHFYEDLTLSAYERFEAALKFVNGKLKNFQQEKPSGFIGNLNVVIAAFVGKELLLSQTGDAEAYLVRGSYVSVISEGLFDPNRRDEEVFMNIASGDLTEGDFVVFSSSRLLRYMTKTEVARIFQPLREPISALADLRDTIITEILGRVGVIGVKVGVGPVTGDNRAPVKLRSKAHEHVRQVVERVKRTRVGSKVAARVEDLKKILPEDRFTKHNLFVAFVVVLIIFVLGSTWLYTTRQNREEIARFEGVLTEVQDMINLAESKGQFDKDQAAAILKNAEAKTLEVLNAREFRSKASQILDSINEQRALLDNVRTVETPQVFADLSLKKPNVNNLGLLFLKDRLFAFEFNALYEIILDRVQSPMTIDQNETVILGSAFDDIDGLVFATKARRIVEYRDGRFYFMDTGDGAWNTAVDIKAYGSRLYLLDPERNKIWRYSRGRDRYGAGETYNIDGDVSGAVAMAIDGALYVAKNNGSIMRFYAGKEEPFPIKQSPMLALASPTKLFTHNETGQMYILEAANNRVLVYNKDAKTGGAVYSTQYRFPSLDDLRDVYVDQRAGKLYVADATKVYVTDL